MVESTDRPRYCTRPGLCRFQSREILGLNGFVWPPTLHYCQEHYAEFKCRSGRGEEKMGNMTMIADYHYLQDSSIELALRCQYMWKFGLVPYMDEGHFHYINNVLLPPKLKGGRKTAPRYGFPDIGGLNWNEDCGARFVHRWEDRNEYYTDRDDLKRETKDDS